MWTLWVRFPRVVKIWIVHSNIEINVNLSLFGFIFQVTLKADEKNTDGPKTLQKRVQIITNCTCQSCDKVENKDCEILDEGTAELPQDLFAHLYGNMSSAYEIVPQNFDEVPDFLNVTDSVRTPTRNGTELREEHRILLKKKLLQMVKTVLTGNDLGFDEEVLQHLEAALESTRLEPSHQHLMSLFNAMNTEDVRYDISKIKEVLFNMNGGKDLMEKHRNFGLGNHIDVDDTKMNADEDHVGKSFNVKKFVLENNRAGKFFDTERKSESCYNSRPRVTLP